MSNKRGSSCSTPGAGTPAPAPRRLFRRSPGDVPCPPLGAGTRTPLPVSPPFMPFTVRSHDGSECRSRLGRVGPRPAHRPSRRAGSPSSPAPLAGGSPSISPSVLAGWGAVLPAPAFWPIFQRAPTTGRRCRGSGARQSWGVALPLRSRAAPPAARAPRRQPRAEANTTPPDRAGAQTPRSPAAPCRSPPPNAYAPRV